VDPHDEEAIAEGMRRLLEDAELRRTLRERGPRRSAAFTWTDTARRTAAVLRRVGEA
jgi:glycosyltransferase involved in cell wall biosynthesis